NKDPKPCRPRAHFRMIPRRKLRAHLDMIPRGVSAMKILSRQIRLSVTGNIQANAATPAPPRDGPGPDCDSTPTWAQIRLTFSAVCSGDFDAAVEIINVDLSGYDRAHVETLRSGPAWPKLMELAAPASAELLAINQFVFTAPRSWATPTTLIAGELSRNRPPYGPSVDMFLQALNVEGVTILADQDHLAQVTSPQDLAQAINEGLATG
ncbi:pimeloyl-ACP methyl ester carboxylesterase, partial [Arthrobacter sp. CG_A4]|nr:pimeloyl-ACP methyl ester carboxylesterase [Arthrobacter sp. CG_A4]